MPSCPVCGPKLSICGMLLSVWGIIMLALLGIAFRVYSPALIDDLPINEDEWAKRGHDNGYINGLYEQASTNCFIASGIYIGVFAFSFFQHKLNSRSNYGVS